MKSLLQTLVLFGFVAAILPILEAQDVNPEPKKTDEKKIEEKKKAPVRIDESVILRGQVLRFKVRDVKSDDNGKEILVSSSNPDKFPEFNKWDQQAKINIAKSKTAKERADKITKYTADLPVKLDEVYSGEERLIKLSEGCRIRTAYAPPQYDKAGRQIPPTSAQLTALKGGSTRLPGYVAPFDALRKDQLVDIYSPKSPAVAAPKQPVTPLVKKGPIGADPNLNVGGGAAAAKIEAFMVLVIQDAP